MITFNGTLAFAYCFSLPDCIEVAMVSAGSIEDSLLGSGNL